MTCNSFALIMFDAIAKIVIPVVLDTPASRRDTQKSFLHRNRYGIVFDSGEFSTVGADCFGAAEWVPFMQNMKYAHHKEGAYINHCTKLSVLKDPDDSVTNTGCLWSGYGHKRNDIRFLSVSSRVLRSRRPVWIRSAASGYGDNEYDF